MYNTLCPLISRLSTSPLQIRRSPQKSSFTFWTAFAQKNLQMKVGDKDKRHLRIHSWCLKAYPYITQTHISPCSLWTTTIFCRIVNVIINTIKIGRTKMSWNNHVYCQLDMLANIVNKGLNNFTQREYMEGRSHIFFSHNFLTLQDLKTIHVGITDLFNKRFKSYT